MDSLSSRKIPVQKQYMTERVCHGCLGLIPNHRSCLVIQVGNCAFASDDGVIRNMTREMEEIYTAVFGRLHHDVLCAYILCSHGVVPARGDGKKACNRLRAKAIFKSHHFNTFRSGLLFGFAIFALVDGLLKGQYF
jgi:hypothetical protein